MAMDEAIFVYDIKSGRKYWSTREPVVYKKIDQRQDHKCISPGRRSSAVIYHVPEKCDACGSRDIKAGRIVYMKQVTDIPTIHATDTVSHHNPKHYY